MEYAFTINRRLFSEFFARHRDTFVALCELVNNALQAQAKEILINVVCSPVSKLTETQFQSINIRDNGVGVSKSEFGWKILEIATDAKEGGRGIGRFAALQLGATMSIETVAFDLREDSFFQTSVTINSAGWDELKTLDKIRLDVEHKKLEGNHKPYYQVTITDFYGDAAIREDAHKRIHRNLAPENIEAALFARYADTIVRKAARFVVNRRLIDPANYVIGDPENVDEDFTALDGTTHPLHYQFMLVQSTEGTHHVFLRVQNSGIQTVAHEFDYAADIPEPNRWFIFVDSPYFDGSSDAFRNLVVIEIDPNAKHLHETIKAHVDAFLAKRYEHYRTFLEQLKADEFYPYKKKKSSSETRTAVFNQLAYHIEAEHHLLTAKDKVRRLVYNLMNRALSSRDYEELLTDTLSLDDQTIARFRSLREKADLEDVIVFTDEVAAKTQFLDFLQTLVYGAPARHLRERSQLHKIVQSRLWLFGENYADTPVLFSDKGLKNNLAALREKFFAYEPTEADGNMADLPDEALRGITDLFFFNEKILDDTRREVMVVELKAPKVKIHKKEIGQAEDYALAIKKQGVFPEHLSYKIILVSTQLSDYAQSRQKGGDAPNRWLVYDVKEKPVEVWAIRWSDLIEINRRKLSYLGNVLNVKDRDVKSVFDSEFADVPLGKLKSVLDRSKTKF
jgi:hypothetical protein